MTDPLFVICPEITPGGGGLADYTLRLLDHWRRRDFVRLIVPEGRAAKSSLGNEAREVERTADALLAALPDRGGRVLLQYSAYGFDRFGYPRWLLRALCRWRERSGGLLVVMFHEIWTFWPVLNKNYLVQQLHRRELQALLEQADAAFTSTASQASHLQTLAPDTNVEVLPVGTNIRVGGELAVDRAGDVAVLFGLVQTRCRTLETMQAELKALAEARVFSKIITIGAADSGNDLEKEQRLLSGLRLTDGYDGRGALEESAVSRIMSGAMFGISAQDELSVTKSGTLMAYAAHGLNILSPHASCHKSAPLCWFTSPAELLQTVSRAELVARSRHLREWQEETAAWPVIAEKFARALQFPQLTT
ncbi:hypothetical protein BH18VER1_BH18VER1_18880 [soil metagenome]